MKLTDFVFRFESNSCISKIGMCRVRLFITSSNSVYAVLTELDENPAASITNSISQIYNQLLEQHKIPASCQIIEHYPPCTCMGESFHRVVFDYAGVPNWKNVAKAFLMELLECADNEFDNSTIPGHIQNEINGVLNGLPAVKHPVWMEDPSVTDRRRQIEIHQRKISELEQLLTTAPSESTLCDFIKEDMSLLGEFYAAPTDEYICFSEFPVGDGRVDFAVFTGRSRMDVYLIEAKGAEHNMFRKDHYGEFKKAPQEARGQLEERATWISSHYDVFRKFVYNVYSQVLNQESPYRAFRGPKYALKVDPNKDIKLHYIAIAGRTNDDIADSQKRHKKDLASAYDIHTESWHSWLNKHPRKGR